jgi:hypothetical protein
MTTTLRFADHDGFHRTAREMALAGLGAALAALVLARAAPWFGGALGPLGLAVIGGAVAFAATPRGRRLEAGALTELLLLASAAAAALAAARDGDVAAWLGPIGFAAALAIAAARGGAPGWPTAVASIAALLLARIVLLRLGGLAPVPGGVAALLGGLGFGLVALLGILPRHVAFVAAPRADRRRSIRARAPQEMLGLLDRADAAAAHDVAAAPALTAALGTAVDRLYDIAAGWLDVEADTRTETPSQLDLRRDDLRARLAAARDPEARRQYEAALAAVEEQRRYVGGIAAARERVVARMHRHLATIERIRLAAINSRSADAARGSGELEPLIADLDALGRELVCTSEALAETEGEPN